MSPTNVENFAAFAQGNVATPPPAEVVSETKRILLDALGCGLAATSSEYGRVGIDYGRILGASGNEATIIGQRERTSVHGAAFANSELITALDLAPINLPAHVAPYALPLTLALGESRRLSGARLLSAVAVCLEMSFRLSKSMDDLRDVTKDGVPNTPRVFGYSSMVFGLTAAASMMKDMSETATREALGIAGGTSPVNSLRPWQMHVPITTVKYGLGGGLVMTALTAAYMAELGHRGNTLMLDDEEFGYPGLVGSKRWDPSGLSERLGTEWRFPAATSFKPYTQTRTSHATLDTVIQVIHENDIKVEEIDSIVAYGEAWSAEVPVYVNRVIDKPYDAQFSFAHGISVAAHRIRPGKDWQDPAVVFDPSVLALMSRVEWRAHPDWGSAVNGDPLARPARVELSARGKTFVGERSYPKGSSSPDPATYTTTEELLEKFRHNADGVLSPQAAEAAIEAVMGLEHIEDLSTFAALLRPEGGAR
ncbi:MmgE/PrpD family protein [Arthrobacter sp. AK01]|uniref:MmgE/PrpD family protein n=1 Tax=Arthrobacter sp. AK01 TaxID=2894084 RepID=UPI001E4096F4|nr:MmgE/PrpD family protein [Arthrobacter sp. AK01]MCD4853693.1 MmgE/PrpD family protein [Arthrobacter sp. AK01]